MTGDYISFYIYLVDLLIYSPCVSRAQLTIICLQHML